MSIQDTQSDMHNPLLINADKDDVSIPSVNKRRHSDPTHSNSTLLLPDLRKKQYAVAFIPILADETGHGLESTNAGGKSRTTTLQEAHGNNVFAVFMLCSVSLGVGVFVLPGILLLTGIWPGIIMLAFYAILALFAQLLALECADKYKSPSYEQLASTSLGRIGEFLLAFFMAVSLLTGNCGHIQTVGQLLHDIIEWFYLNNYGEYKFEWKKTAILYTVMLSLTLPWLFQRSLHGLSGVGTLSVLTVLITAISFIIICFINFGNGEIASNEHAPDYTFDKLTTSSFWITDFWRACPTMAFVYTPLLELFPVYNELNGRNSKKTRPAIYIATFICFVVYVSVSLIVVIRYGTHTKPNSLYNVPADNYWFTFCCFILVIVITLLYPVINYPMLNAIETIMDLFRCCQLKDNIANDNDDNDKYYDITELKLVIALFTPSLWKEYIYYHRRDVLSIVSIFVVIGIDIGVTDLDDLFGLCGSLGLSFVCYIFPCLIYLRMNKKNGTLKCCSIKFLFSIFVLMFSTVVMVYSTIVIILNIV